MPTTFGVQNIPEEFAVPVGCVVKQVQDKRSIDTQKYRGPSGTTIRNIPKRLVTQEITIELEGIVPLTMAVAGEFTSGVPKITRIRVSEGGEVTPTSTVTMKAYSTRGED